MVIKMRFNLILKKVVNGGRKKHFNNQLGNSRRLEYWQDSVLKNNNHLAVHVH